MADQIKTELGFEVAVREGARGEFTVRVDDIVVAKKTFDDFPTDGACVKAVREATT